MLGSANEIDAGFFKLIHHLAGSSQREGDSERRGRPRRPFMAVQWVAPCSGQEVPADKEFFEVQCNDLSEAGFSFFMPDKPEFDTLVVKLGVPPNMVYVGAEVMNSNDVLLYPNRLVERIGGEADNVDRLGLDDDGTSAKRMVMVGCRFTHRMAE
jgi:hypothetical protein